MQIDKIITSEKMYIRYLEKYDNPLRSYYGQMIPERIIQKFYKQASVEEIAVFWFGYHNTSPGYFVSILSHLERQGIKEIPVIDGILSIEFWQKWQRDNLIACMDLGRIFGRC